MKILFIGPLPNPITGHSLACEVFLEELMRNHQVDVINLSKDSLKQGLSSFRRVIDIIKIISEVRKKNKSKDIIYLTISESFWGNIKDVFIYLLCFRNLSRMLIHLHGGSLKKLFFDKHFLLFRINKYFISRMAGVIVLSKAHVEIFRGVVSEEKIHIVPNFSQDYFFSTENEIANKFIDIKTLRILFLGNLIRGKGFDKIIDAYLKLNENFKQKIQIDFAGAFESDTQKEKFIDKISSFSNIKYHGVVQGIEKRNLLFQSHLFCLPTSLHEGQPISILEAYSSGCVVITTRCGGIPDIFNDKINGFEIEAGSVLSLVKIFDQCIRSPEKLLPMAHNNFKVALEKYRTSNYTSSLMNIIRGVLITV